MSLTDRTNTVLRNSVFEFFLVFSGLIELDSLSLGEGVPDFSNNRDVFRRQGLRSISWTMKQQCN